MIWVKVAGNHSRHTSAIARWQVVQLGLAIRSLDATCMQVNNKVHSGRRTKVHRNDILIMVICLKHVKKRRTVMFTIIEPRTNSKSNSWKQYRFQPKF